PIQRYDPSLGYIGSGDYVPKLELCVDGDVVLYTDHLAETRRLRAMVLRAHAMAVAEFRGAHGEYPPHFRRRMRNRHRCFKWERATQTGLDLTAEQRAARLLLHWAKAIEEGRL